MFCVICVSVICLLRGEAFNSVGDEDEEYMIIRCRHRLSSKYDSTYLIRRRVYDDMITAYALHFDSIMTSLYFHFVTVREMKAN